MEKTLYIVRGISGTGKTTTAHQLSSVVFEADLFFGKDYNFDASKLGQAHSWCAGVTETSMRYGVPTIAVANTFTTWKEIRPYAKLATAHGYGVHVIIPDTPMTQMIKKDKQNGQLSPETIKVLMEKNTHKLPEEVYHRQALKWQTGTTIAKRLEEFPIESIVDF